MTRRTGNGGLTSGGGLPEPGAKRTRAPRVVLTIETATRLAAAMDRALRFLEQHRFKGEAAKTAEELGVTLGTAHYQLSRHIGQATASDSQMTLDPADAPPATS